MENECHQQSRQARIPVLSFPVTKLMGISVRELISDSDTLAKGMQLLADRLPTLAALSMMDLTVETECFGGAQDIYEDAIPSVTNVVVHNRADAEALQVPAVGSGRTQIYIDAIRKAKNLSPTVPYSPVSLVPTPLPDG